MTEQQTQPWYKDGNIILRLAVVAAVVVLACLGKLAAETAAAILMGLFGGTAIGAGGGGGKKLLGMALLAGAIGLGGCSSQQAHEQGIKSAKCLASCAIQCGVSGAMGASQCEITDKEQLKQQGIMAAQCLTACALQCGLEATGPIGKPKEVILGGHSTKDHPAAVGILVANGLCSGILVAPDIVLTAAHCVVRMPLVVISGGDVYDVLGVKMHPDFVWDRNNDVGLIKLAKLATASPVAIRFAKASPGEEVAILGYGMHDPMKRKKLTLANRIGKSTVTRVSDSLIYFRGEAGVCSGDSGGAVIAGGQLVGMTIRTIGDCEKKHGIAVRLDIHRRWIRSNR